MPDLFLFWNGRSVWIEVKRKGSYPSKEQKDFIARSNKNGVLAFVARSIEDLEKHLLGKPSSDLTPHIDG